MENRALVKHPTLVVMLTGSDASAAQFAKQLPLDVAARLTTTARGALRGANSDLTVWRTVGLAESVQANFTDALNELRAEQRTVQRSASDTSTHQLNRKLVFRAVVLCDVLEDNLPGSGELKSVAAALRAAGGAEVELQLALMLLHQADAGAAPADYAIRVQATRRAAGGGIVEADGVREAARHVLVAMLTAGAAWDKLKELSGTNHWVTVGAAAVNMRQTDMHAYAYGAAVIRATRLLAQDATPADLEQLQPILLNLQDRSSWLTAAEKVLTDNKYARAGSKPDPTAAFRAAPAFSKTVNLPAHYKQVDTESHAAARTALQDFLQDLASQARKQLAGSTPENEIAASAHQQSSFISVPNGLAKMRALITGTRRSLETPLLLHDAHTNDAPVSYCFTSPALHSALAAETAASDEARQLRHRRIQRSVLHPLGQIAWLLPAALALDEITRTYIPSVDHKTSTMGWVVACAALGIAEYFYWSRTVAAKQKVLAEETALAAGRQAVALLNTAFGRAHQTAKRALDELATGTAQIQRLLKREIESASRSMRLAATRTPNTFRTIFLANYAACDERVGQAVEAMSSDPQHSLSTLLADTMFPAPATAHGPAAAFAPWRYPAAMRELFQRVRTMTEEKMRTTSLRLDALITQDEATSKGAMWGWLVERALPLGLTHEHTKSKLWFCTAVGSIFFAADGGAARLAALGYEPASYEHLESELDCEVVCIRAFVDTPYDLAEIDQIAREMKKPAKEAKR